MKNNPSEIIKTHKSCGGFIKTSDSPLTALTSEQKVVLNRKGNIFFNEGDIASATRLFITTGYSDGLNRIGDNYKKEGDDLTALKFYLLAHNKTKSDAILEKIASVVSNLIQEDENNYE